MTERRAIIEEELTGALRENGIEPPPLRDDLVLLDSGLDSIQFAILVARLEEKLGFDPFIELETAVYPQTLGEFVQVYEKYD